MGVPVPELVLGTVPVPERSRAVPVPERRPNGTRTVARTAPPEQCLSPNGTVPERCLSPNGEHLTEIKASSSLRSKIFRIWLTVFNATL